MGKCRKRKKHDKCDHRGAICGLLERIPPNYPVENLFLNGLNLEDPAVTAFVTVDRKTGLAYFLNGDSSTVFDCSRIDGIDWA